MNRRIRNRTYGGVGGRRAQARLLPDAASDWHTNFAAEDSGMDSGLPLRDPRNDDTAKPV